MPSVRSHCVCIRPGRARRTELRVNEHTWEIPGRIAGEPDAGLHVLCCGMTIPAFGTTADLPPSPPQAPPTGRSSYYSSQIR